jgi:hypothetical protein
VAAAKGRALIQSSDEHLFSLAALFRWKVSNPLLIGVTAVCGLIAHPLLQPQWVSVLDREILSPTRPLSATDY